MPEFTYDAVIPEPKWLVDKFIPLSHLGVVLAQSGVGKSLFLENLGVCIAYGMPFCGFETVSGDVLIIDQDTPTNTLLRRLQRFAAGIGVRPKNKLFYESMRDYYLSNLSLLHLINSTNYRNVKLVIIDSLHTICGSYDPNRTVDMTNGLSELKAECLSEERTIMINHHISEKSGITNQDLLSGDTHKLSMGSSAIIQQADTYYTIAAEVSAGVTTKMFVRPISKRLSIPIKPVVLRFINLDGIGERLEMEGFYEPGMTETEIDVLGLFEDDRSDRSVKEIFDVLGQKHSITDIRKALKSLTVKGKLIWTVHGPNRYQYRLP